MPSKRKTNLGAKCLLHIKRATYKFARLSLPLSSALAKTNQPTRKPNAIYPKRESPLQPSFFRPLVMLLVLFDIWQSPGSIQLRKQVGLVCGRQGVSGTAYVCLRQQIRPGRNKFGPPLPLYVL